MRKLVNGKVVDIKNMELFELAAESLLRQSTAISNTSDGIDDTIKSDSIKEYLKLYDIFLKSMPYPLYAVEEDIKYATLGTFLKTQLKNENKMWIRKGLHIKINDATGMTIHMVNNTWSIEYNSTEKGDNTDISLYKDSVGYAEYKWILDRVTSNEKTSQFYAVFMKDFIAACNGNPMILKWELENILTFSNIPDKMEIQENKIIDTSNNTEYTMDIFLNERVKSNTNVERTINLVGKASVKTREKIINIYSFDTFMKKSMDKENSKIEKGKLVGMQNVFNSLNILRRAHNLKDFPSYCGFKIEDKIVYCIENRLYECRADAICEPKDIAHGVEIIAVEDDSLYFSKKIKLEDKLYKLNIYRYNTYDESLRICAINFSY